MPSDLKDHRRVVHLTRAQRHDAGRQARKRLPRSDLGAFGSESRPDPVDLLEQDARTRVPELVPIRYGRMVSSVFAFYRGAASVMSRDLADAPSSGLQVQLCGDAHLANFGGFGAPDRDLLFDVNDFDETLPGPFEWDLKRLVASFTLLGRDRGLGAGEREDLVAATVMAYRDAMKAFADLGNLDVWYLRLDEADVVQRWSATVTPEAGKRFQARAEKAHSKDRMRALARLTTSVDGEPRFLHRPPLLVPLRDLLDHDVGEEEARRLDEGFHRYRATLAPHLRHLLESYRLVDTARKVVGVGSVGTRCWVALLLGVDDQDPLVLQVKEAGPSVLERHLPASHYEEHGRRVVEGQRLLQAAGDEFLGWDRTVGLDGKPHDFYVRQLWDWKMSADLKTIVPSAMRAYAEAAGWILARGHARSGDRVAIAAYLGSGKSAVRSLTAFAEAYADQSALDHAVLRDAIDSGRITAVEGV